MSASDSPLYDLFYNSLYGNVSPGQLQAETDVEKKNLIQAGMDPTAAEAQASTDVTAALSDYSGTGGFGLSWTGALPSQPGFPGAAANKAKSIVDWLSAHWVWLLVGLVVLILLGAFAFGGFGLR